MDFSDPEFLKLLLSQSGYDSEGEQLDQQLQMVNALRQQQPQYRTGWGAAAGGVGKVLSGIQQGVLANRQKDLNSRRTKALEDYVARQRKPGTDLDDNLGGYNF